MRTRVFAFAAFFIAAISSAQSPCFPWIRAESSISPISRIRRDSRGNPRPSSTHRRRIGNSSVDAAGIDRDRSGSADQLALAELAHSGARRSCRNTAETTWSTRFRAIVS